MLRSYENLPTVGFSSCSVAALILDKATLQESLNSVEEEGSPSTAPRQPLHPLTSRSSLADRLPPRPSELLKVPINPMLEYYCTEHKFVPDRKAGVAVFRSPEAGLLTLSMHFSSGHTLHVRVSFNIAHAGPTHAEHSCHQLTRRWGPTSVRYQCRMASWGQGSRSWQRGGRGGWCLTGL